MRLAAAAVAMLWGAAAWPNGYAASHEARDSGGLTPATPKGVCIVHEDLRVSVNDLGCGHAARIHAADALRSAAMETVQLPIVFAAEGLDLPGQPGSGLARPQVTLDGAPVSYSVRRVLDLPKGDQAQLRRYLPRDELFLDPGSGKLYASREAQWGDVPFALLSFAITLRPRQTRELVVKYGQRMGLDVPRSYQLTYLMTPATYWEGWGDTDITVVVPRTTVGWLIDLVRFGPIAGLLGLAGLVSHHRRGGRAVAPWCRTLAVVCTIAILLGWGVHQLWGEHIAIDPAPTSHTITATRHIYRIHLARPSANLHVGIDPPGPVRAEGI